MIHDTIWVFVEACISLFDILILFMFLNGFLGASVKSFIKTMIAFIVAYAIHFSVSVFLYDVPYAMLLSYTVIAIVVSALLYSGRFYIRLFSVLLFIVFIIVIEIIAMMLVVSVFKMDMATMNTDTLQKFLTFVVKGILTLIALKTLIYFRKSNPSDVKTGYRLILLIVPAVSLLVAYVILDLSRKIPNLNPNLSIFSLAGLLYTNVIIFVIFEGFMRQMSKEYRYKLMEKQFDMQLTHYNQLAESRAHTREIWHDFKNHVHCIKTLHDNRDDIALEKYINDLTQYSGTSKITDTGNPVIDAILNNKDSVAKQNGIELKLELMIPSGLAISPADACVVLGNSLDNAIEACSKIKNVAIPKEIKLSLVYQNGYLVYSLSNTIDEMPQKEGGRFKTWKSSPELHGLGLRSIERTVRQYNGNMVVKCENGLFRIEVLMLVDAEGIEKEGA